ncbi:MAG: PilZ domain-containing protein [Lachnospiraceae bacterium]|nr:PilZ domain-containing protein [Lachnospiraceae bacterium]
MEFANIGTESKVSLCIHSEKTKTEFRIEAEIKKYLDDMTAVIRLFYDTGKPLSFEKVRVHLEYTPEKSPPYYWHHVRIVLHKGWYVLRVPSKTGVKLNRRNSFRVSVGVFARTNHEQLSSVTVRDISHSGFGLSTTKKDLTAAIGDTLTATFSDQGFDMKLTGRLVRIEKREEMTIYGFCFTAPCADLDSYIMMKQRPLRTRKSR